VAKPTYVSRTGEVDLSVAHLGAGLLGLPLLAQGEQVARLLEARHRDGVRFPDVVVEMGRRGSKTTSVWSTIVGRAATRERYRAVMTAQRGVVASRIVVEHANLMIRAGHAAEAKDYRAGGADVPLLYRYAGRETIRWPNGNEVMAVPPDPGAIRSAAADDLVIDEGGELDPLRGQDFIDALRPLQDTRGPLAQYVLMGTPGKVRAGPFWTMLERGRARTDRDLGIADWCIRDEEDADDRRIWRRVHPGPSSGLTPMRVLEKRYRDGGPIAFAREYLCRWPADATTSAIDAQAWAAAERPTVAPPAWCGVAFDAQKDGMAASISAAWRVDGVPHVALLEYRPGTAWVARELRRILAVHRGVPAAADHIGANMPTVEDLSRGRPKVLVMAPSFKQIMGATQTFVSRLPAHQAQPDLERAVAAATWRDQEGGRLFGRRKSTEDISPLVSAVVALWAYDSRPERRPVVVMSA
jgi:hypothetical protein